MKTERAGPRSGGRARGVRRWLFGLRGAMVLLLLVVMAAIATSRYLSRRGRLREEIVEQYHRAEAAWQKGDMPAARARFRAVLDLIDRLGDEDHFLLPEARRKYGEARVIADLLPISLEELARRAYAAPSPHRWQQTFEAEHRGRTVIFVTSLPARPSGPGLAGMAIGYHVQDAEGHAVGLDFTGCDLFADPVWREGSRVAFAATLERMQHDPSVTPGWTLAFDPDGYLLIRDERLLETAGFEVDDEVRAVIAEQRAAADRATRSP